MKKVNTTLASVRLEGYYYILKDDSIVYIYNDEMKLLKKESLDSKYSTLTYVENEKCFYLTNSYDLYLYKTKDFKSFESEKLKLNDCDIIKDISYCPQRNAILITTSKSIYEYNLCKKTLKVIYIVKEEIKTLNDCMGPLCGDFTNRINLLGAFCCQEKIYTIYNLGQYYLIGEIVNKKIESLVYKTIYPILSYFYYDGYIYLIILKDCQEVIINTNIECDCECYHDCCGQIIKSIADVEKSIAKILDAESLKIKSAVEKSQNVDELICLNSSVENVIYYVSILEFILVEKLKSVKKNNNECC